MTRIVIAPAPVGQKKGAQWRPFQFAFIDGKLAEFTDDLFEVVPALFVAIEHIKA